MSSGVLGARFSDRATSIRGSGRHAASSAFAKRTRTDAAPSNRTWREGTPDPERKCAMFGLVYDKAEWAVAALLVVAMVAAALA